MAGPLVDRFSVDAPTRVAAIAAGSIALAGRAVIFPPGAIPNAERSGYLQVLEEGEWSTVMATA